MNEALIENIVWTHPEGITQIGFSGPIKIKVDRFVHTYVPKDLSGEKLLNYLVESLEKQYHQKPISFKVVNPMTNKETFYKANE